MTALSEMAAFDSPAVGVAMALTASAFWAGSTTILKGPIVRDGPRAMNTFRVALALAFFAVTTVAVHQGATLRLLATENGVLLLLSGALGLAVGDYCLFLCVKELGAQPAVTLNQLSPVWSAALGAWFGSELLALRELVAIALVILGVVVVVRSKVDAAPVAGATATRPFVGVAAGLLSSLCNAGAGMISRRCVAAVGALQAGAIRVAGALVVVLAASLATRTLAVDCAPLTTLRRRWLQVVAVFFATFLGIFLQQGAFARIPASHALCLLSTTPIFLLPLAVGILHERYRATALLGTALALAGIWLLVVKSGG